MLLRENFVLVKVCENHDLTEEGPPVVDYSPGDLVAYIRSVRLPDVEHSNIIQAIPDAQECSVVAALFTKEGVKECAECVDIQF